MENRWTFQPTGEQACDVEFFIAYEFKSRTLALLMGAMFDAAFRRFAAAFERRADQIYGDAERSTRASPAVSLRAASSGELAQHAPSACDDRARRTSRAADVAEALLACDQSAAARAAAKCTRPTGLSARAAARPGDAGDRHREIGAANARARLPPWPRAVSRLTAP